MHYFACDGCKEETRLHDLEQQPPILLRGLYGFYNFREFCSEECFFTYIDSYKRAVDAPLLDAEANWQSGPGA